MASTGDQYVLNVQKWLNKRYGSDGRFKTLTEDGYIGWGTINGLIRALQIELGIQQTADNFGTGTINAFNAKYARTGKKAAIVQQADGDNTEDAVYGIIQGALLCKGYSTGVASPTLHFYNGTGNAIKKLKSDAGLNDTTSDVTLNVMKALLSMDYFVTYKTDQHSKNIRSIQQYLNGRYEDYIGIKPCDGVYQAGTSRALMYALQAEEKLPVGTANGNFGPATKSACPVIPYSGNEKSYKGTVYTNEEISKFIILARIALYVNGFEEEEGFSINGIYTDSLRTLVTKFQAEYAISTTGNIGPLTWPALLISCGDTSRSAIACDCATIITEDNIQVLKDNGIKYIGRYLSGTAAGGVSKGLSIEELQLLFDNGIKVFPIHQGSANKVSYFTSANAKNDAEIAIKNADNLKLPYGTIIYFAVDCDPVDVQVTNYIIPYFKVIFEEFIELDGKYKVGIYGPRNVCTRVCNEGYACSSFVADMATGYSGNLGYGIPKTWAFDQFATTKIYSKDKTKMIEIDKDGFSGRYTGINKFYNDKLNLSNTDKIEYSNILVNLSGHDIPVYESKEHYNWPEPTVGTQYVTAGAKVGSIKNNDGFVFIGVEDTNMDCIHKVIFKDNYNIKVGYIEGQHIYPGGSVNESNANINQRPEGSDLYTQINYLPDEKRLQGNGGTNSEFLINQPVPYYKVGDAPFVDEDGNVTIRDNVLIYEGVLQKGDKIFINSNNHRKTRTDNLFVTFVDKVKYNGSENYEDFKYYVSVGFTNDMKGEQRAWY